ncbi:polysaccharide biosynthesis tyrosine autokinase [Synechococcus sp. Cruz-9H2]|uniref:GumC family protein n=1 Tax=unclassified Synechococcus TaxID=2626047 RepID=UPI0020CCB8C9|nr:MULTISPECIES: polysaccharide biosynthesis tyrosine autokinase [unclassified Synechococcus]MCP9817873.1 polysaccharide biosynthesis tyrosine autokinase [Synechococcus sp. Cruz-9H2]MCP9842627.1 polysaccharide biosynthesis tyrosine autokinase [Synechococcus sp. Edmonson 11F2]MCP9854269.1 polysaccharide biosynthesis tyrosine autokinase [Synechococcus sp. Cruz-9C9]MCP9862035.1 polysaccharide biosynthesis tyrosine autokinase [Synechococcus sp. Cruz-7E5]MCP9868781.1 polysaccharide biosynthesis tyr
MASITTEPASAPPGPYALVPPAAPADEGGVGLKGLVRVLQRRRGIFLLTTITVTAIAGLYTVYRRVQSPVFLGGFSLLIADPISDTTAGGSGEAAGGAIASVARNVSRNDVPTLIRVLESPVVLEPVFSDLQRRFPEQTLPRVSVSLVSADPTQKNPILASGVLAVQARGGSPDLVNETLRLTEKTYLNWALQQRREKLTEGVKFLDQQAPELQARSSALQGELERFRTSNNVLAPEAEAAAVRSQAEELRRSLESQLAERRRLQQVRADVASGKLTARTFTSTAGDGGTSESARSSTSVTLDVPNQPLLTELTRLEGEIAEARSTYTAESPYLRNLISARDQLKPALQRKELEAVDATLQQLDGSISALRSQIGGTDDRFRSQPALLRQYEDLQKKLEIAQGNLASYLSTRDQFQLEIAQNNVPWKVISPAAVNPTPVEPRLGRGLLQGLLLGLVAGGGVALLRDRLDHVFHTPGEVRDELKVPLLGHIPYISFFEGVRRDKRFLLKDLDAQQSGIAGYQRFTYQEAFRNLYTSLRFLNSDRPVKSVAVSSSVPSEGKSLLIVLLAKTLSELGKRVLLVDADLRQPQVHHRLGLNNLSGLSNLLTEEGADWRSLLQTVPDHESWQVLTAGRRVPDPPRLLSSERMGHLVTEIAESGVYDLILYDTPPALGLADASLLAENLDGMLLVVGLNKVDRQLPAQAIERIKSAGAPLLGIVTNARIDAGGKSGIYGYAKYGYGSYTDGATALDPSTAYNYYSAAESVPSSSPGGLAAIIPNRQNIKRWKKSLNNWLN